jgi:type IV secretion system protein VirB4
LLLSPYLDNEAKDAIRFYTVAREGGGILDATETMIGEHDFTVFEMEALKDLGREMALPVLTYIFHLIDRWTRSGRPTILTLDEVWAMLDDPEQAKQIKTWLKLLRKKNTAVIFATQSLEDLAESAISATLMQSCPTKIFLANAEARTPANRVTYKAFGLTDWQITMLSRAIERREYYVVQPAGRRMIALDLGPAELAFLGVSDPLEVGRVRALIEEDRAELEAQGWSEGAWWPAKWIASKAGDAWAQLWIDGPPSSRLAPVPQPKEVSTTSERSERGDTRVA